MATVQDYEALPFSINETITGASITDTIASTKTPLFEYQVPVGMHLVIKEGFIYFFKCFDGSTTPVQVVAGSYEIRKEDALGNRSKLICAGSLAEFAGSLHDKQQQPSFPMDVALRQTNRLVVYINSATVLEADNSDILIKAVQISEPF